MANVASTVDIRPRSALAVARDLFALCKPRITLIVLVTAACGMKLARREIHPKTWVFTLLGTALIVGAANALNMWLERDTDGKMSRTRNRPLPAGRLAPSTALWFGVALAVASLPMLVLGVNTLTGALGFVALASYVLLYTPMKRWSIWALWVGAIPGAIPPLLGWTAGTGRIDAAGAVLFGVLFLWQIPHFCAIATFRKADYARAGIHVLPNVTGELATRHTIVRWTFALVATSLLVVPLGVAHHGYLVAATLLGAAFFTWGCYGLREGSGAKWAKSLFGISIVYLVLLFAVLAIDP